MNRPFYRIDELHLAPPNALMGVIGNPIAHSKSPAMQEAALKSLGLPHRYIRLEAPLQDGGFEDLIAELTQRGFFALNITVPFKKKAYTLAAQSDKLSQLCEASNTLVKKEDGWHAYNTDGPGFQRAVELLSGRKLQDMSILVLGSCGGAGCAIAAQAALAACPRIYLINRPRPELEAQQKLLQATAPHSLVQYDHFDSPTLQGLVAEADLIVNATVLGLSEGDPLPIPVDYLQEHHIVYDIVPHATAFNRAAEQKNYLCATGEDMLLWQGVYAFKHWFTQEPDAAAMKAALQ